METVTDSISGGSKITADGDCSHEIKTLVPWKKIYDSMLNLDSMLNGRDITLPPKSILSNYGFSSSRVWLWVLDCEESWVPKNWSFLTVILEKSFESPLDCKEIQPVHPNGNQSWIFIVRTDVEAETPILCPPDVKIWLIWKDPDAENDWRQEEKGMTEDEMVG